MGYGEKPVLDGCEPREKAINFTEHKIVPTTNEECSKNIVTEWSMNLRTTLLNIECELTQLELVIAFDRGEAIPMDMPKCLIENIQQNQYIATNILDRIRFLRNIV